MADLSRQRGRGLKLDIEDEIRRFLNDVERGAEILPEILMDVLDGPAGEAIMLEAKRRMPIRTGATRAGIGVWATTTRKGAAEVMVGPKPGATHPTPGRAGGGFSGMPLDQLTLWLESGVKPHTIRPYKRGRGRAHPMKFGGRTVWEVNHPGFRARRVMSNSLRVTRWEVESAIVDALHTKWAPKMGFSEGAGA